MPSAPPPLPHSPPANFGETSRIHWPVILASASVSLALVAGVIAWIAAHPRQSAPPLLSLSVAAVDSVAAPPAPPQKHVFSATPAIYHAPKREVISSNMPSIEADLPPLPPPASPQAKQHKTFDPEWPSPQQMPPPKQPAGETYGTQVLFHNNRETAADLARREHKLLFVMHISGNFEDSCFT